MNVLEIRQIIELTCNAYEKVSKSMGLFIGKELDDSSIWLKTYLNNYPIMVKNIWDVLDNDSFKDHLAGSGLRDYRYYFIISVAWGSFGQRLRQSSDVSNAFYGSISRDDFESSAIGCLKIISIAIDCNLASLIKYFRKCILWCTWYNAINMITTYGSKKKIILYDFGAPIDGDEYVCDRLTIKSPKPYTFFMFNETPWCIAETWISASMLRKHTPTNHNLTNVDSAKALSNRSIRLDNCDMSEVFPALDVEVRGYLNKLTLLGKLGKEMLLSSKLNDKYDWGVIEIRLKENIMSGEGILRKIKRDVNYKVKTLHDEIMSEKNIPNEKDIEKKKRSKEAKKKAFQYVRISSEEIWRNYYDLESEVNETKSLFSKIMMLKTTIKLISDDKLYYISHFTDFRGRVYSRSIASPIINKMIRPLIVIDENNGYSEVELLSTTAYAKLNEKFNEFYENFDQITNFKIALLTWSLGKLESKRIVQHNKFRISTSEFIKNGLNIINENPILDIENEIEKIRIIRDIKMLKKGYRGPITISVDSTASGQQVLFKYCKSKDNITKRALNLIGEEWCDTYTYILDEFNRTLCGDELKTSIKILNRKMVKTGIMTKFYNVTDYSFKEYVKKNICKKMDSNEYKEFTSIIDKLRNFLEKEYIPRVLNGKKLEELKEDPKWDNVDITYKKKMKKSEERHRTVIKNSDIMKPTSSSHFYTSEETAKILDGKAVLKDMINDIDKTKLARPANIAHKLDSDIVTQVVKELKVYAIHDNFIGNDVEIMKLFDMMNKHYESTDDYSLYVVK